MSINVRGTLAVLAGCVAAAAGAAGASPAVAAEQVPVTVPLGGLESALQTDVPDVSTAAPLLTPGTPEGPRFEKSHVLPQGLVPKLPLGTELPATHAEVPLPSLVASQDLDRVGVSTEGSAVHTETAGASVNPPLTGPRAERLGVPDVSAPQLALGAPDVQARPGADVAVH
ncbi:hypothetical protein [Streptomyces beihaiensis]|uniref:Secreted protein n=1 Tax=Streptomyces beihaiensis TaxID=2984495 RepID=A0ABT3TQW8_9ACTN|nr:hypothetical protein [Streptomyces beihaiensis]MCX3059438.1 hypothetical protein [Streptomyces beihaiensis]